MAKLRETNLSELKHDPMNPNIGTEAGRALIRRSLADFGFLEPGVLDRNDTLLDGNKRTDAAAEAHISKAVIVEVPDGQTAVYIKRLDLDINTPEGRAASIVLNRSAQKSINFDPGVLRRAAEMGVNLSAVGFSDREKLKLGITSQRSPDDLIDAPFDEPDLDAEVPTDTGYTVEPGDLWRVRDAYLYCGDCRDPSSLALLAGYASGRIAGAVTSPPYAMQKAAQYGGVAEADYINWFGDVQANLYTTLAADAHFFLNIKEHSQDYCRSLYVKKLVIALVERWHWHFIDEFIWKQGGIPGDPLKMGKFKNQFEPVFWFAKQVRRGEEPPYPFYPQQVMIESDNVILDDKYEGGVTDEYQGVKTTFSARQIGPGMAYPGNIISARNRELLGHEAAYPVALPGFFIQAYSQEGEFWIDPFGGSGTTAVAALNLERGALLCEIQPRYVETSLLRLEKAFGTPAEKIGNYA